MLGLLATVIVETVQLLGDPPHRSLLLVKGLEGGLEAGEYELLYVPKWNPNFGVRKPQLLGHRCVGDQAVVRIDGHSEAQIEVELEGVGLEIGDSTGLHIAGRTAFKRQAVIIDIV